MADDEAGTDDTDHTRTAEASRQRARELIAEAEDQYERASSMEMGSAAQGLRASQAASLLAIAYLGAAEHPPPKQDPPGKSPREKLADIGRSTPGRGQPRQGPGEPDPNPARGFGARRPPRPRS